MSAVQESSVYDQSFYAHAARPNGETMALKVLQQERAVLERGFQVPVSSLYVKGPPPVSGAETIFHNRLVRFVGDADMTLNHRPQQPVESGLFRVLATPEQVERQRERYLQTVLAVTNRPGHTPNEYLFLMSGGAEYLQWFNHQVHKNKLTPIATISQKGGTFSGRVQLERPLPARVTAKGVGKQVVEDVWDSGETMGAVLDHCAQAQGMVYDREFAQMRLQNAALREQHVPFDDGQYLAIYKQTPQWMHRVGLRWWSEIYKNEPFKQEVETYAKKVQKRNPKDEWAQDMRESTAVMRKLDPAIWVTGGRVFDMGVEGKAIRRAMPSWYPDTGDLTWLEGRKLRLFGHTDTMYGFNVQVPGNQERYIGQVANALGEYLMAGKGR